MLKDLVIDNDTTNFLPKSNPSRILYHEIEESYGGNMLMGISIKFKDGFVYSKKNLKFIEELTDKLEGIPNINKVTSITNADYIVGTDAGIETAKLIEDLPESSAHEELIKEKLNSWNIYKGNFYSNDYRSTLIAIKLELGAKNKIAEETYKSVKKILKEYKDLGNDYYVAGLPSILVIIANSLREDIIRLVPFVVIILILTLFFSFRSLGGIVLPTITVLITVVCTLGLMALFHINLTMIASAIPVLMVAVGSAYGIHIINHYYSEAALETQKNGLVTEERNREIIHHTLKRIGGAVLLAALTTMAGFGSLATSKIVPLREFGIFTSIGVLIALIVAITFIPAILLLKHKPLKQKNLPQTQNGETAKKDFINRALVALYNRVIKKKVPVIVIFAILFIVAIFGTSKIIVGNPMINYFRNNTEIKKADKFINENFNGTTIISVVVKGQNPGDLTHPEILHNIDELQNYLTKKYPDIGNVVSFIDMIKKMNQVMNVDEDGDYYEIPYDPQKYRLQTKDQLKQLITQYLLLFSGNLTDYVDDGIEPSQTKIDIMLKNGDFDLVREIEQEISSYASKNFPKEYSVVVSGNAELQVVVSELIVDSQISNIISSLLAVFLILSIYFRSPVAGFFGVITLAVPILINFGVMGFFKIRLDAGTSMVAAVAIGIGIDYTIHFINAYHHERKVTSDLAVVTTKALTSSGRGIIFNALSVGLGFLVMVFSNFLPLVNFGALVALTMFTASFSAMTLLPVMLNIFKPKFISK